MKKLLEIKGQEWLGGQSIHTDSPIGGLFQTATNFDPFERIGVMQPALTSTQLDSSTITTAVHYIAPYNNGGAFAIAYGDRSGTGAKCAYRINLSDNTVSDQSSAFHTNAATGALKATLLDIFKSRIVYGQDGSIRSLNFALGGDANLLTSANINTSLRASSVIGADGNLYYTAHNTPGIGKIVTADGTTSNTASAFSFTDTTLIPRDLVNDGRYLVILADNNSETSTSVSARCVVIFWDMAAGSATQTFSFNESYILGAKYVKGYIHIMGARGIWQTRIDTPPTLVRPIDSNGGLSLPTSSRLLTSAQDKLFWASGSTGGKVFGYGNPIGDSIAYQPYTTTSSSDLNNSIAVAGTKMLVGTDAPAIYLLNHGSTRATATLQSAVKVFDQPYRFNYIKVVLKSPLSSGQSVAVSAYSNGGSTVVSDTSTKSFSTVGAKSTLLFPVTPSSSSNSVFEDLSITITSNAPVYAVRVYATPLDDLTQQL